MENFLIITTCLLLGAGLRRLPGMPADGSTVLNQVVINMALPALVLLKIPELAFGRSVLVPVLMPWLMLLVFAALTLLVARRAGWSRQVTGCLLLLVPLGNTSFLGIPMVNAFFGESGVAYAVLYDQLGSFLALAIYGSLIVALYGREGVGPGGGGGLGAMVRQVAARIIRFPPFIALLAGFAMNLRPGPGAWSWPEPVAALLATLAATLVPLVMLAVGWQLTLRLPREYLAPLGVGLGLKMAAAPVLALLLCWLLGWVDEPARVAIFEAGMPPMISAGALAMVAGLAPSLAAGLAGFGVLLAFITLPLLHQLMVALL